MTRDLTERSPLWRNVAEAVLLLLTLLSIAAGVKFKSYWPVAIAVPVCVACQFLVIRFAPVVVVPGKKASERKLAAVLFLGLLVILLLWVLTLSV